MKNIEEDFFKKLIDKILEENNLTKTKLNSFKTSLAKKYNLRKIVRNPQIIAFTPINKREEIVKKLNIKPIRELSGVTVVALFAKPHPCPHGKCIYCPGGIGSVFGDTPQSYTGKEPAARRAIRNNYDPYFQIFNRLEHYIANGHIPDKLELIFMGGTFPSLDKKYRDEFVNFTYKAINDFAEEFMFLDTSQTNKVSEGLGQGISKKFLSYDEQDSSQIVSKKNSLNKKKREIDYEKFNDFFLMKEDFDSKKREEEIFKKIQELKTKNIKKYEDEILKNETSLIRSIGLTIETKPDWAKKKHCLEMLKYGCTRLEIGVQTLDEECLKKTNRGHNLDDTKEAFEIAKNLALKINAHMMIGLPASTLKKDEESLINLFEKQEFRPDMLKIYPCLVNRGTPLFNMWKKGLFKPIDTKKAAEIIARAYIYFPRYVRVMRVQRDIPTNIIEEGVKNSNLRQFVEEEMREKGIKSKDIRSREIGIRQIQGFISGRRSEIEGERLKTKVWKIEQEEFKSSNGIDYFIDVVNDDDTMIGFIRLRFPNKFNLIKEINEKTALIRELHIYGQVSQVGENDVNKSQHKGWGRKLLERAEHIAKENKYEKMAIISGVGVREYYRKFGYVLEGTYMIKTL